MPFIPDVEQKNEISGFNPTKAILPTPGFIPDTPVPTKSETFKSGLQRNLNKVGTVAQAIITPGQAIAKAIQEPVIKPVANALTASTQAFGKTIGETIAAPRAIKDFKTVAQSHTDISTNLQKAIADKKKLGQDTRVLEASLTDHLRVSPKISDFTTGEVTRRMAQTPGQNRQEVIGEALGTGVESLSGGAIKGAFGGLTKLGQLGKGKILTETGVDVLRALPTGYLADVSQGLSGIRGEDRKGGKALIPGIGTALSVGIPTAIGGVRGVSSSISKNIPKLRAKAVDDLEQKYSEIAGSTTSGKKKLDKLDAKTTAMNMAGTEGKTPQRILAEDGIIPRRSKTKLDTFEQASDYIAKTKPLREANRQALEEIKLSTPKLSLDTFEAKAIMNARSQQNINAGIAQDMEKNIRNEFTKLRQEYPDGMIDIVTADDIKSARWDKVFKNKSIIESDRLLKDSEYSIAKAFQKEIEDTATKAGFGEVAQLNREIGDRIGAAKFLEELNGKTIKGGRLLKYVTTAIGASAGNTPLGKLAGALGGNAIGEAIISNNVSSPIKRILLTNLEKQDPKAYAQTLNWLKKQDIDRETRLLLSAPAPLGSAKNPIITPAPKTPTTFEKQAGTIRRYSKPDEQLALPAPKSSSYGYQNPDAIKVAPKTGDFEMTSKQGIIPAKKSVLGKLKNIQNKEGGFVATGGYKESGNLTTKILKDLEGKTTVSKQYILDATNRGELKQVERDITRQILDTMEGDTINVKEFADKVKSELLPLKVNKARDMYSTARGGTGGRYENIALPDELRGSVKNYEERIYESPIKTSAGQVHFGQPKDGVENYFGHTRIEDMADNKTRRVIEVQSDLYQKGNLDKEAPKGFYALKSGLPELEQKKLTELTLKMEKGSLNPREMVEYKNVFKKADDLNKEKNNLRIKELSKLQQYNDPTAHFRMIREEIKKASQDGKTKLQFPTGETAMKIEGLGETATWDDVSRINKIRAEGRATGRNSAEILEEARLKPDELHVGQEVKQVGSGEWIITDVLGDGKFKAVPKQKWDDMDAGVFLYSGEEKRLNELWGKNQSTLTQAEKAERDALFAKADQLKESFQFNREIPDTEQFDISGKVDTNNPIYKFYEKDVQKYLNKFGGKKVVDDKGVSWIEIPITKEQGNTPVDAFGKVQVNPLFAIAGVTAAATYGAGKLGKKKK